MKNINYLFDSAVILLKVLIIVLFNLLLSQKANSQTNNQVALKIENDKIALKDRYYTNGIFLTYKRNLTSNFVFNKKENNQLQYKITLANQTYSPTEINSYDTNEFDRPYAGWLGLKFSITNSKNNSAYKLALETGITGKESQAGSLQTWFHDFFNIKSMPNWYQEIKFRMLVNIIGKYIYQYELGQNQVFHFSIQPTIGTKDINSEQEIKYIFGKFNTLKNSTTIGMINTENKNELYGFLSLGYKYVAHNTLIQGGLKYEDVFFTSNISNHILKIKTGINYKFNKNTLLFKLNYNTKETPKSESHIYGTIAYSYNF